ncbi:uncharacterized protein LOC135211244 [Macrobrachium nipponense]|uniref:uncharacterized protein LOC135211244 n=1 Tax=Macrobrachium nipponense TaxID=159736 RepID=UPI0030C81894
MLVNTRTTQSVFLPSGADCSHTPDATTTLMAANGTPICSYSMKPLKFSILGRNYIWPFIVTDVKTPLLGADFLTQHGLLVDVGCKHLLDTRTCHSLPLAGGPCIPTVCSITSHKYGNLLQEFPDIFKPELRQVADTLAKHGVFHHITTTGTRTHAKFHQPAYRTQKAIRAFSEMERMGICQKASSLWSSPLHMVKKLDGT